ncbi:MAG: VWA domain-containing protein [Xenococcaceae cyanobacterium]
MKKKSTALFTTIASWTRRVSLSALILGCLSSPIWGQVNVKEAEIVQTKVNEDQVTLRVKVRNNQGRPAMNLKRDNFQVFVDDDKLKEELILDWKSPQKAVPPPAEIIILLDFSGSMNNPDKRGGTKLKGAIQAIREFIKVAEKTEARGGDIKIAIVPFGYVENSEVCDGDYPVTQAQLSDPTRTRFLSPGDANLANHLNNLESRTPCASTDLYTPLIESVIFLGDKYPIPEPDPDLPQESLPPQPRLAVILLSDGFHNRGNDKEDFNYLKRKLTEDENYSQITVHTLGYGLTPEELGRKYKCDKKPATREDIGKGPCKVPPGEFVARDKLAEIAKLTGGVHRFSGYSREIGEAFEEFLNAILGEYEITYLEPNPVRGSKHEFYVTVEFSDETKVASEPKGYTITSFGRTLPLEVRILMVLGIFFVLGCGGIIPFWFWGQRLKREFLDD